MEYQKLLKKARKEAERQQRLAETETKYASNRKGGLMAPLNLPKEEVDAPQYGDIAQTYLEVSKVRQKFKTPEKRPMETPTTDTTDDARAARTIGESQRGSFKEKMMMSESGGRSGVQIQAKSGGKMQNMTGLYQFSDGRLEDFKKSTGMEFSTEQFRKDPALQERVFDWHINQIDKAIDNVEGTASFSRDGLRAVAHLGGTGGMIKFVKSNGKYNPADKFGTSLQDYYDKFK